MTSDLKHYLALIAFLSIGLAVFLLFDYNRQAQIGVVLIMGAGYVLWGIIHHSIKKELYLKIILEYLFIAVVASMAVIFLLLRT